MLWKMMMIACVVLGHQAAVDPENHFCPICHMDLVDHHTKEDLSFYVEMSYGQRVHACNMLTGVDYAKGFRKFSHPAHLAVAMHKYIASDPSVCNNTCDGCDSTEILDPSNGKRVTSENFSFVCIRFGQKIYFSSKDARDLYLEGVKHIPYLYVSRAICGDGVVCVDNLKIPDVVEVPSPASATDDTHGSLTNNDGAFCTGKNAMFSGFTSTVDNTCVLLLFQPWVLSSATKYVLGAIGVFAMALFNEGLVRYRENVRVWTVRSMAQVRQRSASTRAIALMKFRNKALLSFLYMIQMTMAYWLMLIAMTYETGLFITLILGFGVGYLLFKSRVEEVEPTVDYERSSSRRLSDAMFPPSAIVLEVDGMKCMKNCGTTVENALRSVEGVTFAKVHFKERQAIVVAHARIEDLIEAVECVGFSARPAAIQDEISFKQC